MRNSLQDQLLKAGLVDDRKVKQANKDKSKARKQAGRKPGQADEQRLEAERVLRDKTALDKQRAAERNEQLKQKEIEAQVSQIIAHYRQPRDGGDTPYNLADDGTIKKIWVGQKHVNQLVRGQLAIVRSGSGYELIPAVAAEKIADRMPTAIVVLNEKASDAIDEDDPYKDFPIPDDLMW